MNTWCVHGSLENPSRHLYGTRYGYRGTVSRGDARGASIIAREGKRAFLERASAGTSVPVLKPTHDVDADVHKLPRVVRTAGAVRHGRDHVCELPSLQ